MVADDRTVLDVRDLKTHFFTRRGVVKAVDGVSFALRRGEALGLVGESGSGKSVTALSILRLVPDPAGKIVGGEILLDGEDLLRKSEREMREGIRGRKISMILQDPMTSLDPLFTIGDQLIEAVRIQPRDRGTGRGTAPWHARNVVTDVQGPLQRFRSVRDTAVDLLEKMWFPDARTRLSNYPHQLSGGMRQRVVGAIALAGMPSVLIADEPTTALDATVQAQYLRILRESQGETQLSILFITHDLGIIANLCHRVAVMYMGRIVEIGGVRTMFDRPHHPYTQGLLASVPRAEERVDRLKAIPGQPPMGHAMSPGCAFAPRCAHVLPRCGAEYPPMVEVGGNHAAACWLVGQT